VTGTAGTLTITQAPQTITFTSTPPSSPLLQGTYAVSTTGGGSGNPVILSIDASSATGACSLSGSTVQFTGIGTCVIDADQAGNADYLPATQTQQALSIGYAFSGFLPPLKNPPVINTGQSGRVYPVKWQLTDANGQYVSTAGPTTTIGYSATSCSAFTGQPTNPLQATSSGGTALRYDTTANQYVFNWATPGPGCYTLFVQLASGQVFDAYFNLS
jgi:hypothetical protein